MGSPWLLGLAIGVIGAGSSAGAQLSSVAGRFAEPSRRATVLGMVTAGISAGILLGRIVGGWLADAIGWRGMLLLLAAACAVVAVAARAVLPAETGDAGSSYLGLLRGLPGLYARFPVLRLAAGRGALWFFAFCAVWAGLAVALSEPPFSYSAERIGLYACAGLLGIVATRVAGAWTDRVGARRVILAGLGLAAAATVILATSLSNTVVTLGFLGLFDAGLFAAQVANQSTVPGRSPGNDTTVRRPSTTALFGWTVAPPDPNGYRLCTLRGQLVAALGPAEDAGAPYWTIDITVSDIQATATHFRNLGAQIIGHPPKSGHSATTPSLSTPSAHHCHSGSPAPTPACS
ncbi:MFS transporter [Nocardia tengchongensis]|uniref:MFS transporter n=1 Tax=Nocardia tengchongensis TaxID=2055889 RepID=A0ABX8CW84_9NOCA|nr:MFS transporter [Nocardia tengchongensis]QVI24155.1 MFS transporter [Nocardia tengchongensis]